MPRRGDTARLYDAVIDAGKAVASLSITSLDELDAKAASPALKKMNVSSGQAGMAHLVGPWGYGGYGVQPLSKSEQILHFREWNYRCIDYICARIAKTPPTPVLTIQASEEKAWRMQEKAFLRGRGTMPEARAIAPQWWKTKSIGPAKAHEEYEFLDNDDPLTRLLAHPNDPETGVSLWYEAELFNCLTGEDFIWMVTDDAGRVSELWVIPSNWVRPICLGKDRLVDYFEVSPRGSTSGVVRFAPEEIIWNKMPSPLSKIYATSPLQAIANSVDTYEKTIAARNFGLDNGVNVMGVVQTAPAATGLLDESIINRLESRFLKKYAGVGNFGRPLILEGGLQWVPPPGETELAFMSSADQGRRWLMAQWGLDEVVLGFASVANRAAMVAAIANTGLSAIDPRRQRRAMVLTEKLAKLFDDRAKIFYEDDTPVDPDSRRADFQAATAANAASPNDWRTHILQLEAWPEEIYDRPLIAPGLGNPGETPEQWDGEGGGGLGGEPAMNAPFDGMQDDDEFLPSPTEKTLNLTTKHGAPPRPGLVFDESSHRWVRPEDLKNGRKPAAKPDKSTEDGGAEDDANARMSAQAKEIVGKIKKSKVRAADSPQTTKMDSRLAGAIGEEIIIQHLKSIGYKDAQHTSEFMKTGKNNLPMDLVHDHRLIEAKCGQANNPDGVWALKYDGRFTKEQEASFEKMHPDEVKAAKKKINAAKVKGIHTRKSAFVVEVNKKLGTKNGVKAIMMTVLLNPNTKTADIYQFEGIHDRIAFKSDMAKSGYVGSVKYG